MKTKNFLVSGIVGGIVDFLLGGLFYMALLKDFFPENACHDGANLVLIAIGCLIYGLFIAFIFTKWAQISTAVTGMTAGALIGLFLGLYWNIFPMAFDSTYEIIYL